MKKFSLQNRSINESEQAEKLKSCKMKEGWMKSDEGWRMKDFRQNWVYCESNLGILCHMCHYFLGMGR